jgi:hypothetical protein
MLLKKYFLWKYLNDHKRPIFDKSFVIVDWFDCDYNHIYYNLSGFKIVYVV